MSTKVLQVMVVVRPLLQLKISLENTVCTLDVQNFFIPHN